MIYKLRTSKRTQEIFASIGASQNLQPFALSKLSIALSVKAGKLKEDDYLTDNEGLELNRQTIFGEFDQLFKCLILNTEKKAMPEDEYFPRTVKAHLDRGAVLLFNESRYSKDFYNHLCRLENNL